MSRQPPNSAQVFPKFKVPVRILFPDMSTLIGIVFVLQGQRILDLLCDDRAFFPVGLKTGTVLVNKSHIRQINVLDLADMSELQDLLPEFDRDYMQSNAW